MCTGGSSNPLKDPLYWLVKQDSRGAAELGRAIGWDALRDEGKYNQKNPGHAITKAAETAATIYLGGLMGGGGAESAAGAFAGGGAEGLLSAGGMTAEKAAEAAALQAAESGAVQGAGMIPQGANALMQAPAEVFDKSLPAITERSTNAGLLDRGYAKFADTARGLLSPSTPGVSSGGGKGASQLAMNMGMKIMSPQQAPQQAPAPPLQSSSQPLNNPYGTPQGNSMGMDQPMPGETYEQFMRRKRGMHVR